MLLAKVIASAAARHFPYVCRSEFRGLSQRGGAVQACVRYSRKPITAIIGVGEADLVLGLDALESARALPALKPNGRVVSHDGILPPHHLWRTWQDTSDPEYESTKLREQTLAHLNRISQVCLLDAGSLAQRLGNHRVFNFIMLGAASHHLRLPAESLHGAMGDLLSSTLVALNIQALKLGRRTSHERRASITPFPVHEHTPWVRGA